jgi:hypothetical protein
LVIPWSPLRLGIFAERTANLAKNVEHQSTFSLEMHLVSFPSSRSTAFVIPNRAIFAPFFALRLPYVFPTISSSDPAK